MNFFEYIGHVATEGTYKEQLLIFGIGLGLIFALLVLIIGLIKKKYKWTIIGSIATLIGTSSIGLILGLPLCVLFIWLILKPNKDELLDAEDVDDDLNDIELDEDDFKEEK